MVQIQDLDEVLQAESTDKVMVTHTDNKTDVIKVSNLFKGPEADIAAVQEDVAAIQEELPKKLDNKTTAENAGKAVVVDEEGNLVFGAAGVQVSKEEGNTIEEKEDGIYVAPVTGGSSPVGTILSFIGSESPAGFLLFDGSEYKGEDYPKLYNLVRNYPVFAGAAAGYFKLPNLAGRVLQGATIKNLGELIAAGLPNITTKFTTRAYSTDAALLDNLEGGIDVENIASSNSISVSTTSRANRRYTLLASKGETKTDGTLKTADEPHVYGNSDTVQQAALTINYMIKATNTNESLDAIIDDTTNDTGHAPSTARVNVLARNFAVCNTAAADTVKEVTIDNLVALETGLEIKVLFTNGNTAGTCVGTDSNKIALAAAPKIKVNNLGEYPVKVGGEYAGENFVNIGDVHTFVFDGENWNDLTADVIYKGETTDGNYTKKRNGFLIINLIISTTVNAWYNQELPIHFSNMDYVCSPTCEQLANGQAGAKDYIPLIHKVSTNTIWTAKYSNLKMSYIIQGF